MTCALCDDLATVNYSWGKGQHAGLCMSHADEWWSEFKAGPTGQRIMIERAGDQIPSITHDSISASIN